MEQGGHPRLKRALASIFLGLLAILAAPCFAGDPIRCVRRSAAGVPLHIIDADLNDPRVVVSPAIAAGGIGRSESFPRFIRRLRPAAAINGTYFSKASLRPVGDIVIDGELAHFGGMGTAVAFAPDGVDFVRLPKSRHVDWSEHRSALASGPLLVWDGFAKPVPGGEGFGDPSVFAGSAARSAVGITGDNHLLLVTTARGTSLATLASALRELGAVYALNLDGGSSTAMWCKGHLVKRPGRRLTNVLCVYVKPEPVSPGQARAPRGLDWRGGHPPRAEMAFEAADIRVSALLPRIWEGNPSLTIEADGSLPEGWKVVVWLDDERVGVFGRLPADISLDLSSLEGRKHRLWIGMLNEQGEAVGRAERIFRIGRAAWVG